MTSKRTLEDKVTKFKSEFDDLVRKREKARLKIRDEIEGSDKLYLDLEQAVIEKAKELEEARLELRYA